MSNSKTLRTMVLIVALAYCNAHSAAQSPAPPTFQADLTINPYTSAKDSKYFLNPAQTVRSAPVDIHVHAEKPVVAYFAGFFDATLRTTQIESDAVVCTDSARGTIAFTFEEFNSRPVSVDQPTNFKGLFVLGGNQYPFNINLTARRRNKGDTFNVSLSGLTESESVGVARVRRDTITIRLLDDSPNTTVLTLQRQSSSFKQTAPDSDEQIDFGPAKPYVPDGSPTY